jgi:hypothetical protein
MNKELDNIHTELEEALNKLDDYNGDNRDNSNYNAIEDVYRGIRDLLSELYDLI